MQGWWFWVRNEGSSGGIIIDNGLLIPGTLPTSRDKLRSSTGIIGWKHEIQKDCVIADCADYRGFGRGLAERIDDANAMFTMDDAGNRSNVKLKDESDVH